MGTNKEWGEENQCLWVEMPTTYLRRMVVWFHHQCGDSASNRRPASVHHLEETSFPPQTYYMDAWEFRCPQPPGCESAGRMEAPERSTQVLVAENCASRFGYHRRLTGGGHSYFSRGPSIKYVTLFWWFLTPPLPPVTNCHKSWTPLKSMSHFLDPPPPPFLLYIYQTAIFICNVCGTLS